jgi:predicted DNA-binding transcriptional regulator YafY
MARSTNAQKSERLNAAHRLLAGGTRVADAAALLADECGISLRHAYRYIEEAQALRRPVPIPVASIPITFKIPGDVIEHLRAYSANTGMTLSEIVTRAIKAFLASASRNG